MLGQARRVKGRGSYGLRWTDVDFEAQTISIEITRVVVDGEVVEGGTKSETSTRVCRSSQSCWQRSGPPRACRPRSSSPPARSCERSGYVVIDPLGRRYHPDTVCDYWAAECAKAGVKRIRLHDARHTCGTLMHLEHNVPVGWPPIWTRNTVEPMRTSGTGRDSLDG